MEKEKTMKKREMKPAYCPDCKYYEQDCNPNPEDFALPCESYEPAKR